MTDEDKKQLVFRHIHNKENPYAVISKEGLEDKRLSWKSRGILAYLLGKPDHWKVIMEHLKKEAPDGVRSLRSGMIELQFFGYLEKFVDKEKGKFKQFGYNIYEVSQKPDRTAEEYGLLRKARREAEKARKGSYKQPFLRFALVENSTLVSNDIVYNELNIPSQKKCEGGHGDDEMCDKCEYLKKKIKAGEEFGFEHDTANTRIQLIELENEHAKGILPDAKKTNEQRLADLLQNTGDEYSSIIADYPENMQKPLRMFVQTFKMSPFAIPKKTKGKGGNYAVWINGINELLQITKGDLDRYKLVLDRTYDTWYTRSSEFRNNIDMPQKIKAQFITEDSGLSIDQEKKKNEYVPIIQKVDESEYVTPEEMMKLMKNKKM